MTIISFGREVLASSKHSQAIYSLNLNGNWTFPEAIQSSLPSRKVLLNGWDKTKKKLSIKADADSCLVGRLNLLLDEEIARNLKDISPAFEYHGSPNLVSLQRSKNAIHVRNPYQETTS